MKFIRNILLAMAFLLSCQSLQAEERIRSYPLTNEDKAVLGRIESYLTGIHTITADFIQAAPNGDISTGKFYLDRPGKLRMEYAPPMPVLMVANGSYIVYYDKELDQVSRILLESTLVGFLAREKVRFDNTVIITGMQRENNVLRVSLVQSEHPKDGALTLEFSDNPLAIHNIVIKDSAGQVTTVALNNARFNTSIDAELFVFKDPHLGGKRSIKN
jgi:outer membrane lipoprotein-sorting protein